MKSFSFDESEHKLSKVETIASMRKTSSLRTQRKVFQTVCLIEWTELYAQGIQEF